MDNATILYQLMLNEIVLDKNIEQITHDQSTTEPAPDGNCLNWVVGHLVRTRNEILGLVTGKPMFPMDQYDLYSGFRGVAFDTTKAIALDELLNQFRAMQKPLADAIGALDADALGAKAPFSPVNDPNETIGTLLSGIMYHEAYHLGQTALQRRLIGLPGAIKAPEPAAAN